MDNPIISPFPIVTGSEIKALRLMLGVNQAEFAAMYYLPLRSLQNWEQGHRDLDTAGSLFFRLIAYSPYTSASDLQYLAARYAKAAQGEPLNPNPES